MQDIHKVIAGQIRNKADEWGRIARQGVRRRASRVVWDKLSVLRCDYIYYQKPGNLDEAARREVWFIMYDLFNLKGSRLK